MRSGKRAAVHSAAASAETLEQRLFLTNADAILVSNYVSGEQAAVVMNDRLYWLSYNGALMSSDGTPAGTFKVADVTGTYSVDQNMVAAGNRLFFTVEDSGPKLWVSDGTGAGTHKLTPAGLSADVGGHKAIGNKLFFWGIGNSHGKEPWISDGTDAGTFELADLVPGTGAIYNATLPPIERNGKLYFGGTSGFPTIYRLFATDGTKAGTTAVLTLNDISTSDYSLFPLGSSIMLVGDVIWRWNASTGLLRLGADYNRSASYSYAQLGGKTYFPYSGDLWVSDGTPAGTKAIYSSAPSAEPAKLTLVGNQVYFLVYSGSYRWFRTDGTTAGTSVAPRPAGSLGLNYYELLADDVAVSGDYLFYYGGDQMEYTGTSTGAVNNSYGIGHPVTYHNNIYFMASSGFYRVDVATLPQPLVINGTAGADTISLAQTGSTYQITVNGVTTTSRSIDSITTTTINGLGGNDTISVTGTVLQGIIIDGGDGNDRITAGIAADLVHGGNGDDWVAAMSGADTIYGDAGNDSVYGGPGSDSILLGDGNDLCYSGRDYDSVWGGLGRDTIVGDNNDDWLYGDADIDVLNGGDGRDCLIGGAGSDQLIGSNGDDTLYGGADADRLYGGYDDDALNGEDGNDTLQGGAGNDTLIGAAGTDLLLGELGDDWINASGDGARDTLRGDAGTDSAYVDTGVVQDVLADAIENILA